MDLAQLNRYILCLMLTRGVMGLLGSGGARRGPRSRGLGSVQCHGGVGEQRCCCMLLSRVFTGMVCVWLGIFCVYGNFYRRLLPGGRFAFPRERIRWEKSAVEHSTNIVLVLVVLTLLINSINMLRKL